MNRDERGKLLDVMREQLGEHANAFIIIAEVESSDHKENEEDTATIHAYDGSLNHVLGLARRMVVRLETIIKAQEDEADKRGDL